MSNGLLKFLIPISIVVTGCASVKKDEQGAILMEDVIVERTTVRSTTQNPKPKSGGGVIIEGDNVHIGAIIINSPNSKVDNSVKISQVSQQNQQNNGRSDNYDNDRDFFKDIHKMFPTLIPNLIMFGAR
jgi:ribosomal protein L24